MLDEAKLHEDIGAIKQSLANIETSLAAGSGKMKDHDDRLRKVEQKTFVLWILGPLMLGFAAFARDFKDLFLGKH